MSFRLLPALLATTTPTAAAQEAPASRLPPPVPGYSTPAFRQLFLDRDGVIRWRDDRSEVALFGANYVITTASDYRAAGSVGGDRKQMIDEDMAHFARMDWDGLRLTFWGDWEASDSAGNLIANDHLDLLDYLIARARERGIYMLLSPIQLYSSNWPDALERDPATPGFGRVFGKARMGTDPAALASQVNYLRQILNHVNPYTGLALKDDPAIPFIELVNEPWHHPEDRQRAIRYINALTDAVRSTGSRQLVFYNVSQDFRIGEAIRQSRAQGVSFGWYPTGLVSGHELRGNHLRTVDTFPDMLRPELARMPRIVYEFDNADLRSATMYPAMARTFRAVGAQFAAMFSYDMLRTASRNLGWQTHYLNMAYTPRKAVSAMIAAEAMRRLPRMRSYGPYPANTRFGDFRVSYQGDLAELNAPDAFLYAGPTRSPPADPAALRRIAGTGSSPVVTYEGLGIYFLDRLAPGLWRLEIHPDAVPVGDPFEPPNVGKVVTRAISRAWTMTVALPDLGDDFIVQPITAGTPNRFRADGGRFIVTPGVYLLRTGDEADLFLTPVQVGQVGLSEFHPPAPDTVPLSVEPLAALEYVAGRDAELRARIVDTTPPDSATLFIRRVAGDWYRAFPMRPAGAYQYAARVPAAVMREGPSEFVISVFRGDTVTTFPEGLRRVPWSWDYYGRASWKLDVVVPGSPIVLFDPERDASSLAFTRIGDAGRRGLFSIGHSAATGRPVFHLELPIDGSGWSPDDYTASLGVRDRIQARGETIGGVEAVRLRLHGLGPRQTLHLTLMEDDGTSWTAAVDVDTAWTDRSVPLSEFTIGRGVLLPQGFPGQWSYWVGPAEKRGGAGDRPRLGRLERLQLSLRREDGLGLTGGSYGVEVESVALHGDDPGPGARGYRARIPGR